MDSRVFEWMGPARVAVETTGRVANGENVLIVTDTRVREFPGCRELVDAVYAACRYVGAEVSLIEFTSRTRPNEELPKVVAGAMAASDVVYFLPTYGAIHTSATDGAQKAGARVVALGAATYFGQGDVLSRLVPRSADEVEQWGKLTGRLAAILRKGGTLRVRTTRGTDLTCRIGSLQIHTMDAQYRGPGQFTHFIGGMAGGGVDPGTMQGRQVVDAAIMPIFRPLTSEPPVILDIKDGYVTDVGGGPAASEWKQMADALGDPECLLIAEFGFGCHPRATVPAGRTSNDERLFGGFHLGIGSNVAFGGKVQAKWHVDSSGTAASAWLDDAQLLDNGVYTV